MAAKGFSEAKNYALRLLEFRPRSTRELEGKLKTKGYASEIIVQVVDFLKKTKFLDDVVFARLWVESRIKKPLGPARLRYELKLKGIDKTIIEQALDRARENYNEQEAVEDVVRMKMKTMHKLTPEKKKARLYGYLMRRGYSVDVVMQVLENMLP